MDQKPYAIKDVQSCPIKGQICGVSLDLSENLRSAILAADTCVTNDFSISGCTTADRYEQRRQIAYAGTRVAFRVFGDRPSGEDIAALIAQANPATAIVRLVMASGRQVLS